MMTKQEEIREEIDDFLLEFANEVEPHSIIGKNEFGEISTWRDDLLKRLHSQGMVRKVDRELPKYMPASDMDEFYDGSNRAPQVRHYLRLTTIEDYLEAGYVAVEPLIEEEK